MVCKKRCKVNNNNNNNNNIIKLILWKFKKSKKNLKE